MTASDDALRAAWQNFEKVSFPTVEKLGRPALDELVDVVVDFEAHVAGRIASLVAGSTAVKPDELVVPGRLVDALWKAEAAGLDDAVGAAIVRYTHELVDLVKSAREAAARIRDHRG